MLTDSSDTYYLLLGSGFTCTTQESSCRSRLGSIDYLHTGFL